MNDVFLFQEIDTLGRRRIEKNFLLPCKRCAIQCRFFGKGVTSNRSPLEHSTEDVESPHGEEKWRKR